MSNKAPLTEQQNNTLSDLHYLVANKNYWKDNWHKEETAFEMWRAIDEAIDLIDDLKGNEDEQ